MHSVLDHFCINTTMPPFIIRKPSVKGELNAVISLITENLNTKYQLLDSPLHPKYLPNYEVYFLKTNSRENLETYINNIFRGNNSYYK